MQNMFNFVYNYFPSNELHPSPQKLLFFLQLQAGSCTDVKLTCWSYCQLQNSPMDDAKTMQMFHCHQHLGGIKLTTGAVKRAHFGDVWEQLSILGVRQYKV